MSRRWALHLLLLLAPAALAGGPDCGSVLTDTSRSLGDRRALVLQCLQSSCREEAGDLALLPDAAARFMAMCTQDQFDLVSGDETRSTGSDDADSHARDIACARGEGCADMDSGLEATAAGPGRAGGADAGHTFIRVQRINEVIER